MIKVFATLVVAIYSLFLIGTVALQIDSGHLYNSLISSKEILPFKNADISFYSCTNHYIDDQCEVISTPNDYKLDPKSIKQLSLTKPVKKFTHITYEFKLTKDHRHFISNGGSAYFNVINIRHVQSSVKLNNSAKTYFRGDGIDIFHLLFNRTLNMADTIVLETYKGDSLVFGFLEYPPFFATHDSVSTVKKISSYANFHTVLAVIIETCFVLVILALYFIAPKIKPLKLLCYFATSRMLATSLSVAVDFKLISVEEQLFNWFLIAIYTLSTGLGITFLRSLFSGITGTKILTSSALFLGFSLLVVQMNTLEVVFYLWVYGDLLTGIILLLYTLAQSRDWIARTRRISATTSTINSAGDKARDYRVKTLLKSDDKKEKKPHGSNSNANELPLMWLMSLGIVFFSASKIAALSQNHLSTFYENVGLSFIPFLFLFALLKKLKIFDTFTNDHATDMARLGHLERQNQIVMKYFLSKTAKKGQTWKRKLSWHTFKNFHKSNNNTTHDPRASNVYQDDTKDISRVFFQSSTITLSNTLSDQREIYLFFMVETNEVGFMATLAKSTVMAHYRSWCDSLSDLAVNDVTGFVKDLCEKYLVSLDQFLKVQAYDQAFSVTILALSDDGYCAFSSNGHPGMLLIDSSRKDCAEDRSQIVQTNQFALYASRLSSDLAIFSKKLEQCQIFIFSSRALTIPLEVLKENYSELDREVVLSELRKNRKDVALRGSDFVMHFIDFSGN